jgi:hypothetical protein
MCYFTHQQALVTICVPGSVNGVTFFVAAHEGDIFCRLGLVGDVAKKLFSVGHAAAALSARTEEKINRKQSGEKGAP